MGNSYYIVEVGLDYDIGSIVGLFDNYDAAVERAMTARSSFEEPYDWAHIEEWALGGANLLKMTRLSPCAAISSSTPR